MVRLKKQKTFGRKISAILDRLKQKKRKKQLLITLIVVVIIIFFVSGSRGTYQLLHFVHQKRQLEQEINKLEVEKQELEKLRDKAANDPNYIEKIAREKYKFKKKDEKVYQVVEE
jgi:cell division protein FtsB